MRISILGAPGSGKSELMKKLTEQEELADHTFIETPIGELAEQGRGVGSESTYNETLMLYVLQQRKIELAENPDNVVQSGSVIQRIAHICATYDEIMLGESNQVGHAEMLFRLKPSIELFASIIMDTYRTDLSFLLLRPLPLDVTGTLSYEEKVQYHIQDALDKFHIPHRVLVGEVEQQVQDIMEAVNEHSSASVGDS